MTDIELTILFSAMAEKPSEQLKEQGFYIPTDEDRTRIDNLYHALNMVRIHGIFTDSECQNAKKRLFKEILRLAVPIPAGDPE